MYTERQSKIHAALLKYCRLQDLEVVKDDFLAHKHSDFVCKDKDNNLRFIWVAIIEANQDEDIDYPSVDLDRKDVEKAMLSYMLNHKIKDSHNNICFDELSCIVFPTNLAIRHKKQIKLD